MTPLARTMALYREAHFHVWKVEHWNSFAHIRQDLFGIFDLLMIAPAYKKLIGVQVTTHQHMADHERKMRASPYLKDWIETGAEAWLVGWAKRGARNRTKKWEVKELKIRLDEEGLVDVNKALDRVLNTEDSK